MNTCKKAKGFTLIELVVVIVIIGILSAVSVPLYRGYTRRAMASEGRALVGSIAASQKVYYAEHGTYLRVTATGFDPMLDVDARMNKYFRSYSVTTGAGSFNARCAGVGDASGISVTYIQPAAAPATVTEVGL